MAAEVKIYSMHGNGDTTTPANHIRLKLADNDAVDLATPCRIPTADQIAAQIPCTWSGIKYLKLFTHIGPTNSISNLRFFVSAGELGTGIFLHGDMTNAYQEYLTTDSTGDTTAHFCIITGANAWTKASPLVVNAGTVWGAAETGDGTLADQKFVMVQARITSAASPGTFPAVNTTGVISYRYDEQ